MEGGEKNEGNEGDKGKSKGRLSAWNELQGDFGEIQYQREHFEKMDTARRLGAEKICTQCTQKMYPKRVQR